MPSRPQYIAQRIGARMASRGEAMVLRRVSLDPGPVPYRNPPDTSADLVVATAAVVGGQAYLGITGSSILGRLVASDQVLCWSTPTSAVPSVTWTVGVMPNTVQTNVDGIVVVDQTGAPVTGTPGLYSPDALAASDRWNAIAVSAFGNPAPSSCIGQTVSLVFAADQPVYGNPLSLQEMSVLGWTEQDSLGVSIAAYNQGPVAPPQINDLLIVNGRTRAIQTVGAKFSDGVQFLYTVQAR